MKSTRREKRNEKPAEQKSSSGKYEEGLPLVNKKQILGFFLFLFGFLIILSIISYSDVDQSKLEGFNVKEIFKKENQSSNFNTAISAGLSIRLIHCFYFYGGLAFGKQNETKFGGDVGAIYYAAHKWGRMGLQAGYNTLFKMPVIGFRFGVGVH